MSPDDHLAFATRALHVGSEPELSASSAVIPSIDLSTTYAQYPLGTHKGFEYTRSANPTRLALERCLASLEQSDVLLSSALLAQGIDEKKEWEGGPSAVAFSSGSAATATVVSGLAGQGGHMVCVGDVYGGTSRYMLRVANVQQGLVTTFIDMSYGAGATMDKSTEAKKTKEERAEEDEKRRAEEDAIIVARLEGAIQADTKVSLVFARCFQPLLILYDRHNSSSGQKRLQTLSYLSFPSLSYVILLPWQCMRQH